MLLLAYRSLPCSDFTDMLWRLTNCRIIILLLLPVAVLLFFYCLLRPFLVTVVT